MPVRYGYLPILLILTTSLAHGQIVVNSLDDDGGAGDCELREAILNAHFGDQSGSTDCAAGASGLDTIDLTGLSGTITLGGTQLAIGSDMILVGPGMDVLTIDANRLSRVFHVSAGAVVTIEGLTITGGEETVGGGIRNWGALTLNGVRVTDNYAESGSGIYVFGGNGDPEVSGFLEINDSEISNNRDKALGSLANGGGINNNGFGKLTVRRSTISGNRSGIGGGMIAIGDYVTIINSTISGNTADTDGGGLKAGSGDSVTVWNSTITNNTSPIGGGISSTGSLYLGSTIVADNSSADGPDIKGAVTVTNGYNLIGDGTGSSGLTHGVGGDQVGTGGSPIDPEVRPLDYYGGLTKTHLLLSNSPAVDKGSCTGSGIATDQRGSARPQDLVDGTYPNADDACDVGAVENMASEFAVGIKFAGKVLLEGPYTNIGTMSKGINGSIPNDQPYSDPMYDGTLLDYDGPDGAFSIPDSVVDWVLVRLRTGTGPETTVPGCSQAAFLTENGNIVNPDGDSLWFPTTLRMSYYVVVGHRNHMAIMSSATVDFSTGTGGWNPTQTEIAAYTPGGSAMKALGGGYYGMFAADGNVDGQATAPDFNLWNAATTAGVVGYVPSDFNMDGLVTAPDFNLWNANTTAGAASQVPD